MELENVGFGVREGRKCVELQKIKHGARESRM